MSDAKIAFVTGASRGIGRAACIALAERGYDVVVTARTIEEGKAADGRPLPGSIETTAREVEERGVRALPIRLDLLESESIDLAVEQALREWGQIDLLLNNGIYTGPASMDLFMDLEPTSMQELFQANLFAQIQVTQRVLPGMLERGTGTLINMVSGSGLTDPPAPAGKGGWGFIYGASKAAFHRMVGVLAVEHAGSGVNFVNVEPGFVMTEAMLLNDADGAIGGHFQPAPPSVPAAVIAWLADEAAAEWNGDTVFAQKVALKRALHPDWRRPRSETN
ncbi:MAG: NAD(P)-dependent dehydrogenase (short-subunit alcohol dehydrogenase family) [Myxococcota bacterium]|jgi:NAD(P)-dependent dehydrogenase (short-subunit alcohol dehydrogenase family)